MRESPDTIVLSPHLDDAVLSCGGLLYQRARAGARVLVVTVAAGEGGGAAIPPLAADLRRWTGLGGDAIAVRRAEDARALSRLGVGARHLDLPECVLRRHPGTGAPLYPTLGSLFRPGDPGDHDFRAAVRAELAALGATGEVLAPLAVGGHVDHRIVRAEAEAVFGPELRYYEDFPYCRKFLSVWRARRPGGRWSAEVEPLSEAALLARIEAIACYTSQVPTLFGEAGRAAERVRGYVRRVGGERYWRRAAA